MVGLKNLKRLGGTPGPIRTADLLLRRQTLYPAELRAHKDDFSVARQSAATAGVLLCEYTTNPKLNGEVAEWSKAAVC